MIKSYSRDIQLLMTILKNQQKIIDALKQFHCDEKNLDKNETAFDLCSFYMAQIGETSKLLTDETKNSFAVFVPEMTKYFRDMIDHSYEKVNRAYLKAYIFHVIDKKALAEVKERIVFCQQNAQR